MSAEFSNISLYIPHVFPNYSEGMIAKVFEDLKIGNVKSVDLVSKMGQDGKVYNAAYLHFEYWCDTVAARNFQARVLDPKMEARVVYDEPWHWIVLENKARKYVPGERKPRIDLGDLNTQAKPTTSTWAQKALLQTPIQSKKQLFQPAAPQKPAQKSTAAAQITPVNLATTPEFAEEMDPESLALLSEMDECEAAMEELDSVLVSVDHRYLQTLESENAQLQTQIYYLNTRILELGQANHYEKMNSRALARAILTSNESTDI